MRTNPQNLTEDQFGDVQVLAQYQTFDRVNQRKPLRLSGGLVTIATVHANQTYPANGKYKPVQLTFNHRAGNWVQMFVVANRGTRNDTDVFIDDLMIYNEPCQPFNFTKCDMSELKTPKWGRLHVGRWTCSNSSYVGSNCKLFCMTGFMIEPRKNDTNVCARGGWVNPLDMIQCITQYCDYPTFLPQSDVEPRNLTAEEGVDLFACSDPQAFDSGQNLRTGYARRGEVCEFRCKEGYKSAMPNDRHEMICVGRGSPLTWLATKTDDTRVAQRQSRPSFMDVEMDTVIREDHLRCIKIDETNFPDAEEREREMLKSKTYWGRIIMTAPPTPKPLADSRTEIYTTLKGMFTGPTIPLTASTATTASTQSVKRNAIDTFLCLLHVEQ